MTESIDSIPPPCDCCGASSWTYTFSEGGFDLGRCTVCGLYYVAQMPQPEQRLTEVDKGHYADSQFVATAAVHLQGEQVRNPEFQTYVNVTKRSAPDGKWLDLGCGTGTLMARAQASGIEIEGIELTADRRALARQQTDATVYDRSLETLGLQPASFAAVTMIYVFSHLVHPAETLMHINRILVPGGILLLKTGEIGPGVREHHVFHWALGDHLYFLGLDTIERYADRSGFQVIFRDRQWQPAEQFSRDRFRMQGRSRFRNFVKSALVVTPGALPLLRWYMLTRRHAGSQVYSSTLLLRKIEGMVSPSAQLPV